MQYANIIAAESAYSLNVVSIVIPAHNEEQVFVRRLAQLVPSMGDDEFDVVVANGCTDKTAGVAMSFGPPDRVLSISVASKREALAEGNRAARSLPRLYAGVDIEFAAKGASRSLKRSTGLAC